jgi:hypothetical protein
MGMEKFNESNESGDHESWTSFEPVSPPALGRPRFFEAHPLVEKMPAVTGRGRESARERSAPRPEDTAPEVIRLPSTTAEELTCAARNAVVAGARWREVEPALRETVIPTEALEDEFKRLGRVVDGAIEIESLTALRNELARCEVRSPEAIDAAQDRIDAATTAHREGQTPVTVATDGAPELTRTWWEPAESDAGSADRGHVRLVAVCGAQVGDGNRQMTFVVHEVDDPEIDFAALMGDSEVARCLAACAEAPDDPQRRLAAVAALSGRDRPAGDWTEICARPGTATEGRGSPHLDGTVALVHSRSVQIGDRSYQENRVLHTVSPTLAADFLLDNPDVVNRLVDVAARPADGAATRGLERAVEAALCRDLEQSTAPRSGYATVYRPPTAGRTLEVEDAIGVSVGRRASSKAEFAQKAHLKGRTRRSVGRLTAMAGGRA